MKIAVEKICKWQDLKNQLDRYKKEELNLRVEIANEIIGSNIKGIFHYENHGLCISATGKTNIKINEKILEKILVSLSPSERNCIKYKPILIQKELSKLDSSSILFKALEEKPGTPTLSVKSSK